MRLEADGHRFTAAALAAFQPVTQGGKRLGTLYLKSDLGAMYERFSLYGGIVVLVIAASFLVAFALSHFLPREITRPLLGLAETARAVSEQRDYAVRAPKEGDDEIGRLTDAFNQMLAQIQEQDRLRARLEAIVESSDDAIIGETLAGVITNCNPGAEKIFGYHAHEMIGRSMASLIPPDRSGEKPAILARIARGESIEHLETVRLRKNGTRVDIAATISPIKDAQGRVVGASKIARDITAHKHEQARLQFRALFEATVRTGVGQRVEYRLRLPDGRVRHLESQGSVLRDPAGRVVNVLVVSRDITARREAELRLREQASLLDKARDAIIATDLDHRIAYWNPSAERLYGWKSGEVYGHKLEDLDLGYDPARFAEAGAKLRAAGEWRGDFILHTKAGEPVMVESTWSLVVEDDGRPRSILLIDTDVTERKKLETQLLRSQRMESIGTLAGGVAHDLNNVLTPILMVLDLLGARTTRRDERELIEKTKISATHGAALVQQLLAFARGADGQRAKVDVGQTIRDLKGLVRQSLPRSIQFSVESDAALWPVEADDTQFKQVLINLVLNARDAMSGGGRITVHVQNVVVEPDLSRLHPGAHPGAHLLITVADTGSGIPAALLGRIFDPFFTTKAAGKGTGLGLSMVAGIVKSHGGFVQVESEVGKGSAFHLLWVRYREPRFALVG